MAEMKWERCKFHICESKRFKHDYQLKLIGGDCLEEAGVPDRGRALINCQIEPKVGDLIWCDNYMGTIHGYIKQVKSINGDEMIVQTRYKDKSKDFEFYASAVYGVVEMVFDVMGDLRYKRPEYLEDIQFFSPTERDRYLKGLW